MRRVEGKCFLSLTPGNEIFHLPQKSDEYFEGEESDNDREEPSA